MSNSKFRYKITSLLRGRGEEDAYVFAELALVCILDLMEIVLVELTDKGCKVGVFEHAWKDGFREFVHVLDDDKLSKRRKIGGNVTYLDNETIALWTPGHDRLKCGIFKHPTEKDEEGGKWRYGTTDLYSFLTKSLVAGMASS